jgi:membrane protein DedA with SNARE-associated domain
MKKIRLLALAALLTVPVFAGIARIDAIPRFLFSSTGYALLHPLFVLFGAVGVEGDEGVVAGVMLALSFIVAAVVLWCAGAVLDRVRAHRATPN